MSLVEEAGVIDVGPAGPGETDYPVVKIGEDWVAVLWHERASWVVVPREGQVVLRHSEPIDHRGQPVSYATPRVRSVVTHGEVL